MSYPTTRRFFRDDEFRNENAAIAAVVRALALSQNYRYASDLKVTPADPKVYAEAAWPWATYASEFTPVRSFGSGAGEWSSGNIAAFVAPDPRAPATAVKVSVFIDPASILSTGSVTLTNRSTGATDSIDVSTVPAAGAWADLSVAARVGDVLSVSGTWGGGASFVVHSVCAWWDPASLAVPGATFTAGLAPLSQAFHAANGPVSTYALRQLGRSANAFVADRPMPAAAAWLFNPAAGTGAGYSTVPLVVGRYKVPIGAKVSSLSVRLRYRASGACSVTCALSGGGSASAAIGGAGYGVATATITRTAGAFSPEELTLTVAGSPAYCDVQHVLVYENHSTAASLALPSGETVPASFDPNLDERLLSGRAIRADDMARLVANEVWLWAYRRDRVLVNDCRFSYPEHISPGLFSAFGGVVQRFALHSMRTSKRNAGDAFGELRIKAGWHQGALVSTPATWEEYRFQVGEVTSGDYPGAPEVGGSVQYPDPPSASWDSFGAESHQHRRGGMIAGETTYEFETHMRNGIEDTSTRPTWLSVEELPLSSPAATYP